MGVLRAVDIYHTMHMINIPCNSAENYALIPGLRIN